MVVIEVILNNFTIYYFISRLPILNHTSQPGIRIMIVNIKKKYLILFIPEHRR